MERQIEQIAERMHNQGVKGLYSSKGEVNRSAVIKHLIEKELSRG